MGDERSRRIAALFAPGVGTAQHASLCERCVEILHVQRAGVSIMSGRNRGPVCSSSALVRQLEDLQFSLGEGPSHDAYSTGTTVAEPHLARGTTSDWPNYRPIQAQTPHQLLTGDLSDVDAHRAEVHQASGVTAVQLGIDVHEALARIRAHAYSNDQTVAYIAGEIVARRLHPGDDRCNDRGRSHD